MDDSDNVSNASFEQIDAHPKRLTGLGGLGAFKSGEEKQVSKLKALIAKSTIDGHIKELAEGEVPDVCYVLKYKGFGGRLSDVCRSTEPIDPHLPNGLDDRFTFGDNGDKKPILEIVTAISTATVRRERQIPPPPPPMPPPGYPYDDYYSDYDDYDYAPRDYDYAPRRRFDDIDTDVKISNIERTVMTINSAHLINALKAVVGYYPGVSFIGNSVNIAAPYCVLVHHRAALARFKVSQPETHDEEYGSTTARHIDVLLGFLDKTLGQELKEEEQRHHSATPKATFDKLWMLYQPGQVVCAKHRGRWTSYIVSGCSNGMNMSRIREAHHDSCIIDCWNIIYSGGRFRRRMRCFIVEPFSGEEAISSLSVVPASFFRGEKGEEKPLDIMKKEIEMGKKVWALSKTPTYMAYDGSLVDSPCLPGDEWNYPTSTAGYMSGRVIVDCEGFGRFSMTHPGNIGRAAPPRRTSARRPLPEPMMDKVPYFAPRCGCHACSKVADNPEQLSMFAEFDEVDPTSDTAPTHDTYYLVLSNIVSGFILDRRQWGHFSVVGLSEIKFDKEAYKYLVLDDEIKYTVKSLIGKFASESGKVSPWPKDFVKNKGQGRIFLLHGAPGVGKTVTVESMAEYCHRPLISLTSGDLTTHEFNVEKNLEYFLQLGERFGAMVLLDEADVYLETRRASDISRNGLVSIFLRALEYYRGVLFLTTNRIEAFDAAFTSRIHVALHYRNLTDGDRERIWQNSFDRLERDSDGAVYVSVAAREYAYGSDEVRCLRWNGREIRNALQTAVALAETDALEDGGGVAGDRVVVGDKHLRSVVRMSRGFKMFLRRRVVVGEDELEDIYGADDLDGAEDGDRVLYD